MKPDIKTKKPAAFPRWAFVFLVVFATTCVSEPVASEKQSPERSVLKRITPASFAFLSLPANQRVKLIGVKEIEPESDEEKLFLEKALLEYRKYATGGVASFEYDTRERDVFGNELAYVYLRDDDKITGKTVAVFLNAMLIEKGWALYDYDSKNTKHASLLYDSERKAKAIKAGIWKFRLK